MKTNLIRCLVKVKTEYGGTHCYAALFPRTKDAFRDAHDRFYGFGAFVITVRAMP